ncbi:MAG TPA: TetR/AcrR family transcriptional regulator [Solirubrobacterales bacterium]|nr:TetR/AcrR family transcriptional regulator [Solirubrobacterales bacterium]
MSNPLPARKRRQAETRTALLDAAIRLCAERGLEDPSIDEIAAEAGYTKGAFYANFSSKHDLFLAMIDVRFAVVIDEMEVALGKDGDDFAIARFAAEDFIRLIHAQPGDAGLFFKFVAYASREADFRDRLAERYRDVQSRATEIYRRWSATFPAEPPLPLEEITTMVFAMANGFLLEQQINPDLSGEIHGQMLAIFLRGLAATAYGWEPDAD